MNGAISRCVAHDFIVGDSARSPRGACEIERFDRGELGLEWDAHDVEWASDCNGRLFQKDFARDLAPSETLVIGHHPIDAEQKREIGVPFVPQETGSVADEFGCVALIAGIWNSDDSADTAYEDVFPVCPSVVSNDRDVADRTVLRVQNEATVTRICVIS